MRALILRHRDRMWLVPVAIAVVSGVLPLLGILDGRLQRDLALVAIYGLIVAGFNLSFGYGGQLALAQIAVFAGGAYVSAILYDAGITELAVAIPLAIAVAALLGFITGLPGLRLNHWTLALTAFFFVELTPNLVSLFKAYTRGSTGIPGISDPTLFGIALGNDAVTTVVFLATGLVLLLFRNLVMSRYGEGLLVLKHGTEVASALGLSPFKLRMSAYVLGAMPAGLAGALFAYHATYVQPDFFQFALLTLVIASATVGGHLSMWGAVVGTGILVIGPQQIQAFEEYSVLAFGIFLIVAGVSFGDGVAGLFGRVVARYLGAEPSVAAPVTSAVGAVGAVAGDGSQTLGMSGEVLTVSGAMKAFGGVQALAGVDFDARPGAITALIGANGAGKTTMLNAVSGLLTLDEGEVRLDEQTISNLRPQQIAAAGVGRTFQTPQIPDLLTVMQVAMSGRIRTNPVLAAAIACRTPGYRRVRREDERHARAALAFVGLEAEADNLAAGLPLGLRRILEVARSVAGEPSVILLDEPAAGLDPDSLENLRDVMQRMRDAGATVVLVEHNVSFVMSVADIVHVMDLGRLIASGTPEEVRADEKVIAAYLGRREQPAPDGDGPAASDGQPSTLTPEVGDAVPSTELH